MPQFLPSQHHSFRAGLTALLLGIALASTARSAVVINSPGFSSELTTIDRAYRVLTPVTSAHTLTSLTITTFASTGSSLTPSSHAFTVTFYADSAGSRGSAITFGSGPQAFSAISASSIGTLQSTAPTAQTPPFYRFEVTFDLSSTPVSIGAGDAFWYSLSSTVSNQNVFVGPSTADYGNGWGTSRMRDMANAGTSDRTPGIILSATAAGAASVPDSGAWVTSGLLALGALGMGWRHRAKAT
jgi:hypothetical protein